MNGKRIAVVGSNMTDLVTYVERMPAPGETIEAPSFEIGHGGKGANQAMAAARLGAGVMLVTRVGDDLFGDNTLRNLADAGIDTSHIVRVPGASSGVATILVDASGENSILIIKGANATLSPADVDAAAADLREAAFILMQFEVPVETVLHTIRRAAEWGVPAILNPAPAVPELDLSRLAGLHYLVPNETELAILAGEPVESEEEIRHAARKLIAGGIGALIVTLGARGARLVTSDGYDIIDAVPVDAVDTTGAGDAFIGSFARFLAASGEPLEALRRAALYAADSVTRRGAQKSYATAEEFAAFCHARGVASK